MTTASAPIEILPVEDNPADIRLTAEVLKEAGVHNHLSVISDGAEALDFLHRRGKHAGAPVPDLVLLDLHLPRKSGHQVLDDIKRDDQLRHIPVVVLSTSQSDDEIFQTYQLRANAYVTKPVGVEPYLLAVRSIERFWLGIARLARA